MKDRRPITEDDILLTEMLLARSYGNLKQSVVRTSSETLGALGESLGGTVKKHPYATAGAAVGTGILLFGLYKLMTRDGDSGKREKERSSGDPRMDILSMLLPLIAPYITTYLENSLGSMFGMKNRNRNT